MDVKTKGDKCDTHRMSHLFGADVNYNREFISFISGRDTTVDVIQRALGHRLAMNTKSHIT